MDDDRFTGYICPQCCEEIKDERYSEICTCGARCCNEPGAFEPCIEAHHSICAEWADEEELDAAAHAAYAADCARRSAERRKAAFVGALEQKQRIEAVIASIGTKADRVAATWGRIEARLGATA